MLIFTPAGPPTSLGHTSRAQTQRERERDGRRRRRRKFAYLIALFTWRLLELSCLQFCDPFGCDLSAPAAGGQFARH